MGRPPFQATLAAIPDTEIRLLPVSVLLDNPRSMYNVDGLPNYCQTTPVPVNTR